jgi:hypothetical protein
MVTTTTTTKPQQQQLLHTSNNNPPTKAQTSNVMTMQECIHRTADHKTYTVDVKVKNFPLDDPPSPKKSVCMHAYKREKRLDKTSRRHTAPPLPQPAFCSSPWPHEPECTSRGSCRYTFWYRRAAPADHNSRVCVCVCGGGGGEGRGEVVLQAKVNV